MTELLERRRHERGPDGKRRAFAIEPTRGDLRRAAMKVDPTMRDPDARRAAREAKPEMPQSEYYTGEYCPECGCELGERCSDR